MQRNRRVWVILRGILKHIMEELATSQFPCICKTSLYNRHVVLTILQMGNIEDICSKPHSYEVVEQDTDPRLQNICFE